MKYLLAPDARAVMLPPEWGLGTPNARWVDIEGDRYVVVPHDMATTRTLRQLGIMVPSPIGYYYNWPKVDGLHDPMSHQRDTAAFATLHPRCYILNDLGTGKTHSALWAADYLMDIGEVERALILSPISTLRRVWGDALYYTFGHRKFEVLYGTAQKRRELFDRDARFYIINHDGFDIIMDQLAERKDITLVIPDELAVYRHGSTNRTKYFRKAMRRRSYRIWGMTGAPRPNAPTDIYSQCEIVTPHTVTDSFRMFKFKTMEQHSATVWTERPEANRVIQHMMTPALRFTRDQCLDLPECTFSTREVTMSAEQATAYKQMAKEMIAELRAGLITAANVGVKVGKLLQISGGAVYDAEHRIHDLNPKPRLNELLEIRDQVAAGKIIVFASYQHTVQLIARFLAEKYGLQRIAVIHGGVPKGQRDEIFSHFQSREQPSWLVADPGTMAHGLTLTEASTIVWWGPEPSNDIYTQANARITRVSQKHRAHIIHLCSSPVERRLFKLCGHRNARQAEYLEMIMQSMDKLTQG